MITFDLPYYENIDNDFTIQEPVGYCFCDIHKGYITKNEFKSHQCVKKCCKHFLKNEKHDYWNVIRNKSIMKKYYKIIKKQFAVGKITKNEYCGLKDNDNIEFMDKYIAKNNFIKEMKNEYQTKSNYVEKKIIHPKKPSLIARIKNTIKIKYRKMIKNIKIILNAIDENNIVIKYA